VICSWSITLFYRYLSLSHFGSSPFSTDRQSRITALDPDQLPRHVHEVMAMILRASGGCYSILRHTQDSMPHPLDRRAISFCKLLMIRSCASSRLFMVRQSNPAKVAITLPRPIKTPRIHSTGMVITCSCALTRPKPDQREEGLPLILFSSRGLEMHSIAAPKSTCG
jgi:hypothetical protein